MNQNKELAQKIAEKLVGETWLLSVSYGCPYFDGLDNLSEELEKILNEVHPLTDVPKITKSKIISDTLGDCES